MKTLDVELQAEKLNDFVHQSRGSTHEWFRSKGFSRADQDAIMTASARIKTTRRYTLGDLLKKMYEKSDYCYSGMNPNAVAPTREG